MKQSKFLEYLFILQVIVIVALILDVPFVRQISGLIFLIFVPGFLIISIFKFKMDNKLDVFLFSVGLSLAFLMFVGFIINLMGSVNLVSEPLSVESLAIFTNIILIFMFILSYSRTKNYSIIDIANLRLGQIIPFFLLPILSVIGVLLVKVANNNVFLIFVIIIISFFIALNFLTSKFSSNYPIIILSIALALLLSTSLISNYVYGSDICIELDVFKETKNLSYWNSQFYYYYDFSAANSMLSVTILPTIFSNLLSLSVDWVFKLIYPMIFSLLPLGLYRLYEEQWGKKIAFISVIFFIINFEFYSIMVTVAKEMIGEFFLVLLFLLLLKSDENYVKGKWKLFLFLIFGLIVSHYSMNYIFIILILFIWLFRKILFKSKSIQIDFSTISFSFCLTFVWYIFLVQGAFQRLVNVLNTLLINFQTELLLASSRGSPVQTALGLVESPTFLHSLGRIFHNITTVLILIGFISLIYKLKNKKVDIDYFLLISLNIGLIFLAIIIPRFAGQLEMGRLYHITLIFLAPLFVLGAKSLMGFSLKLFAHKKDKSSNERKGKKKNYCLIIVSFILLTFFLFQVGFVYEITDDPVPTSIAISNYKMGDSYSLIHENDRFGAQWLSKYGDVELSGTYSDTISFHHVLTAYSNKKRDITIISNSTIGIFGPTFVYFSQYNVKTGLMVYNEGINLQYQIHDIPVLDSETIIKNKIYSNGGSEIYYLTK